MKTFALKTVKCKIIQNKNRLRSGLRAGTFLELQTSSQFPQLSKSGINRFVMSHDPSKLIPVTYFCKPPHIWDKTKYHSMVNGIFFGENIKKRQFKQEPDIVLFEYEENVTTLHPMKVQPSKRGR